MNVINIDSYRSKELIFSGILERYAIDASDGQRVMILSLKNEKIQFIRPLQGVRLHELNRILLNSLIGRIPICINAEYVDTLIYHVNDIGYYVQDN